MENRIRDLADKFGCILVYFFGTQAETGKKFIQGEKVEPDFCSDLDIAVAFEIPPAESMMVYGEMYKEFSKILEPFSIDLVFMHDVGILFQYEIIRGERVFERNKRLTDEIEEGIMKRAEDLFFKKKQFDQDVMEAIDSGYIEFEYSPGS